MNLAVAFTEYQLLQVQALANHYKLNDLNLIILKNDRIQPWMIDQILYDNVLALQGIEAPRWKRVFKSYIDTYKDQISDFLKGREVKKFIGAQDENTLFALIKEIANPTQYWSIEDGFANYYSRGITFRMGIWFKRKLFKFGYGYNLPIAYAHGQVPTDESFRMLPDISTGNGDHKELSKIMREYLTNKAIQLKQDGQLSFLRKYQDISSLVVSNIRTYTNTNHETKSSEKIYKFHPKDRLPQGLNVDYIDEKVPIEIMPFLFEKLETIRFEVISSSIINLVAMQIDVKIELAFQSKSFAVQNVIEYLNQNFSENLEWVNDY